MKIIMQIIFLFLSKLDRTDSNKTLPIIADNLSVPKDQKVKESKSGLPVNEE